MFSYSIAFTCYNEENSIEQFLQELMDQSIPPRCIIMADGGSGDKTVELAEKVKRKINCHFKIISGKRLNIAEGFNTAIKEVTTEYVGIVAPGNHYDPEFFEHLADNILSTGADISYSPIRGWNTTDVSIWYNSFVLKGETGIILEWPSNHGALIKMDVFQKIGYFYEKFYYAGEDTEFYYCRALHNGITFGVSEEAKLYWETPKTVKEYLKQLNLYTIGDMQIFTNKEVVYERRKSIFKWILVITLFICGCIIDPVPCTFGLIAMIAIYFCVRFGKYGLKEMMLCMAAQFLPAFYLVKNVKYFKKSKKVNIKKSEFLE